MNPLQAALASDKHQDNQTEGIGAANNQCHLVIIETITFTLLSSVQADATTSNTDPSMPVVLSNNVKSCSASWERHNP